MIAETALAVRSNGNIAQEDQAKFQTYLKAHLTDDLVIQVLEELLVEENSTYSAITFEQALKEIQAKDGGRYLLLKTLLEGFANKEGLVMVDPKLVTAAFKERMAQLKMLKAMSRFRRFFYRLAQAFVGLFSEKGETAAIQEAIQVSGEVQIARRELAAVELQKIGVVESCNAMRAFNFGRVPAARHGHE